MNEAHDLDPLASHLPVTALHFAHESLLVVGSGPTCLFYRFHDQAQQWRQVEHGQGKVLLLERVHHIDSKTLANDRLLILAAGGRESRVCEYRPGCLELLRQHEIVELDDRIQDAILISDLFGKPCTAILTAHNNIRLAELNGTLIQTIESQHRPNFYSGRLLWKTNYAVSGDESSTRSNGTLHSAGGTAFGQIVVRKIEFDRHAQHVTEHLSPRLHDGSIFGIDWNHDGSQVLSCSDDRSLRIHQVDFSRDVVLSLSSLLWGHRARAWRCRFGKSGVLSVGEDACLHFWHIPADRAGSVYEAASPLYSRKAHDGLNAWALATPGLGHFCATGGQDGGVKVWQLTEGQRGFITLDIHLGGKGAKWTSVLALSSDQIILVSSSGEVALHSIVSAKTEVLHSSTDLRENDPIHVAGKRYLLIFTRSGILTIIDLQSRSSSRWDLPPDITEIAVDDVVEHDEVRLAFQEPRQGCHVGMVSLRHGFVTHQLLPGKDQSWSWKLCWAAAVLLIWKGPVATIYWLTTGRATPTVVKLEDPSDTIVDVAVQDMTSQRPILHIASYRGLHARYDLSRTVDSVLTSSSVQKVVKGSLTRILVTLDDILLVTVAKQTLSIFSTSHRNNIWQAKYNSFKCKTIVIDPRIAIFWIKQGRISILDRSEVSIVCHGFHGREIRATALLQVDDQVLLATAGEDTTCQLSVVSHSTGLRKVCHLGDHASSIRCVELVKLSPHTVMLLTAGASAQVFCYCLEFDPVTCTMNGIAGQDASSLVEANGQARIMATNLWSETQSEAKGCFVLLVSSDGRANLLHVSRALEPHQTALALRKVKSFSHGPRCCLSVSSAAPKFGSWRLFAIGATDGRAGFYAFKDGEETVKELGLVLLHQSGINSLNLRATNTRNAQSATFECLSGGDDNAITICRIVIGLDDGCSAQTLTSECLFRVADAHSSAIQGIDFLGVEHVVSVGWDQRIKCWKLHKNESTTFTDSEMEHAEKHARSELAMSLEREAFTHVCDPSSLSVIERGRSSTLAVAGLGFEVFAMSKLKTPSKHSLIAAGQT